MSAETGKRKRGRPPRGQEVQPWQQHYIQRAVAVRRRLLNKALAARLGLSESQVDYCIKLLHGKGTRP